MTNREKQFWEAIARLTFNELLKISSHITNCAIDRFETPASIYDSKEFAAMLADYAECKLEEQEDD